LVSSCNKSRATSLINIKYERTAKNKPANEFEVPVHGRGNLLLNLPLEDLPCIFSLQRKCFEKNNQIKQE